MTVVILTRDEERCIARCLDSVAGLDVLVVDTGSVDGTVAIVEQYDVRLVQLAWPSSFAAVRNFAIEMVGSGWIVFLDADEWLGGELAGVLATLDDSPGLVFAPTIRHVDREDVLQDVPRIFRADGGIRYRGAVHEYPVVAGSVDRPVRTSVVPVVFHHDGYDPAVIDAKGKRIRNLELLRAARKDDPDNPRWLYFMVRDGLPILEHGELLGLCATLRDLVKLAPSTGDHRDALHYYRRALAAACQGLAMRGDWFTLRRYCDELGDGPDGHYFRSMADLRNGAVIDRDLLQTVRLRRDTKLMATSVVDRTGRHLDALITAQLARIKGPSEADRYRKLCAPWTDAFFEGSHLRQ